MIIYNTVVLWSENSSAGSHLGTPCYYLNQLIVGTRKEQLGKAQLPALTKIIFFS
jgi:hypothetical protein